METILIPAEQVKVAAEADVCVIGGSCTGVFAAVRAARLGARVILVEKQNRLGGTASCGLVSMWHSVFDATGTRQVIGGLTFEMMERLERCGGIGNFRTPAEFNIRLNSELLTLELDALVEEHPNIRLFLQTSFSRAVMRAPGEVEAVIAENNAGRFAIRARSIHRRFRRRRALPRRRVCDAPPGTVPAADQLRAFRGVEDARRLQPDRDGRKVPGQVSGTAVRLLVGNGGSEQLLLYAGRHPGPALRP